MMIPRAGPEGRAYALSMYAMNLSALLALALVAAIAYKPDLAGSIGFVPLVFGGIFAVATGQHVTNATERVTKTGTGMKNGPVQENADLTTRPTRNEGAALRPPPGEVP